MSKKKTQMLDKRFWHSVPKLESAWDLASWVRNDNASVRAWAALTQCGMNIQFIQPAPAEEDPYGQLVGWTNPTSVVDQREYLAFSDPLEYLDEETGRRVQLPKVQASVQAMWDRLVLDPGLGIWDYDAERAALFGDPELYIGAWQAVETQAEPGTYDYSFLSTFKNQLWDMEMNLVPFDTIQRFVDVTNEQYRLLRAYRNW